ncbi:NAD(P)/FAD-dependent oxidoreductase [Pseudoduganella sp. GCM10020061]|uniref:NAD(P)/FAD-dependent oxidoreductase n=1 Tax=Pseudoduganella sp. GCM10020061 TaxID=3317345 RepID=UPI003628126A
MATLALVQHHCIMALNDELYDVLIVGGGPGGLTAATYLRRFRRSVAVIDKGHSRLSLIPVSHNYPGFPDGVNGAELLERMRTQLRHYGGEVHDGEVLELTRSGDLCFVARTSIGEVRARTVLLASGVIDGGMPMERWHEAVACGAIRLCPVCDGYDVKGKKVGVLACEQKPVNHALFLRTYCEHVTLFDREKQSEYSDTDRERLQAGQVRHIASPCVCVTLTDDMKPVVHTADGEEFQFDVVYPMLGETARSTLAVSLGAEVTDCEKLLVDHKQQTTVPGLFAVGDVVRGLNQIAVATGQAAVAATCIHNALPARYA